MKAIRLQTQAGKSLRVKALRPRHALKGAVRIYQAIHPAFFSGVCRFYPTCSHYALDAIETHGAAKGFVLTLWRIWRCQPLYPAGFDPVPEPGPLAKLIRSSRLLGPGPLDRLAAWCMKGFRSLCKSPTSHSCKNETQSLKARML
jgi:uncharacterized protein